MYLAVHHVQGADGREGLNTYRHEHGEMAWPADPQTTARLPETHPGALKSQQIELHPGGNRVLAYLDVLAPDHTAKEKIQNALDLAARTMSATVGPSVVAHKGVLIRFAVDPTSQRHPEPTWAALRARIDLLLRETNATETRIYR